MKTSASSPGDCPKGIASSRYQSGSIDREPYLRRARRIARLTVTSLFPEQGSTGADDETLPWQSAGSFMVNSLAAKRTMALFPPGIPFYRLTAARETLLQLEQLPAADRGDVKATIELGLAKIERELLQVMQEDGDRAVLFEAERNLVVGGNYAIHVDPEDGKLEGYTLDTYVCWRDRKGRLLEWVIEDSLGWATLSDELKDHCRAQGYVEDAAKGPSGQTDIKVYTHGRLKDGKWKVCQECWGSTVEGTEYTRLPEAMPYLFVREYGKAGEHYGRSYCEDYEADFQTLDGFWQLLTEGSAAIALLKWLVRPGGVTNKDTFTKLPNGGTMAGHVDDVHAVRADKGGDLNVASAKAAEVEQRLSKVFLLYSSIQRKGERVTAEEIMTLRQDLENTQGGVFASQTPYFQAPYADLKFRSAMKLGKVTPIPRGQVKMSVITGDLGLGRNAAAQDLDQFIGTYNQLFPAAKGEYISPSAYLARAAANKGIDPEGLVRSQEEVAQALQGQASLAMMDRVGPEVVRQGGEMLQQRQDQAVAPAAAQQETT